MTEDMNRRKPSSGSISFKITRRKSSSGLRLMNLFRRKSSSESGSMDMSRRSSSGSRSMVLNKYREYELSPDETCAFEKLKELITKKYGQNIADDKKITRFLIARDFDVPQAYLMLQTDIEWRKLHKVDTILQSHQITEFFVKHFILDILGFDKEGCLLVLSNMGRVDHRGVSKSLPEKDIMRHFIYFFELCQQKMEEQSKATGNSADKWTMVINMDGFSYPAVSNRRVLNRWIATAKMLEAHYPERLNKVFVINAPISVQLLVNVLKPFIPLKTMERVLFYGKDGWKEELSRRTDPEVLPAYLGGERTDPDGNPMCYTIVRHGGTVPEKYYLKNSQKCYLRNQQGVKSHTIPRRSKFTLPLEVQVKGMILNWEFETDNFDVDFGLFYKNFDSNESDLLPLIPLQKIDSDILYEKGTFRCENPGTYILMLDNSYSFLRSKNIYYRVSVVSESSIRCPNPR